MSNDLPDFSFSGLDNATSPRPRVRPRDEFPHPAPEPLQLAEARDPRGFEVSPEGAVKAYGYTPNEVAELLKHYREHMIAFGKAMQSLSAAVVSPDAAHYDPGNGGYQ
jgi:hypothetical protein